MQIIRLSSKNNTEEHQIIKDALDKFIDSTGDDWNYITPEKLNRQDSSKYYILDLRDSKTFKQGHIKGAKNIFWKDVLSDKNLKNLPVNKRIILVCYVGHTASQVLVALRLLGYKASVLKFGMGTPPSKGIPVAGWTDFGFDIVKGK